jgi:ferredoxin, 2Fe-2S
LNLPAAPTIGAGINAGFGSHLRAAASACHPEFSTDAMLKITFIQPDGSQQVVETEPTVTLMEAAKMNDVPGIEAECGGACACATCHVYIDDAWRERTGTPAQMEEDMLDFAFDVRAQSRLSCQIKLTPELDGLVVRVPAKQF